MPRLKLRDEGRIRRVPLPSPSGQLVVKTLHPSYRSMSCSVSFSELLGNPSAVLVYRFEELQLRMHGTLMPLPAVRARVRVDPFRPDALQLSISDAHMIHHCEACVDKQINPEHCKCIKQARIELEVLYGTTPSSQSNVW